LPPRAAPCAGRQEGPSATRAPYRQAPSGQQQPSLQADRRIDSHAAGARTEAELLPHSPVSADSGVTRRDIRSRPRRRKPPMPTALECFWRPSGGEHHSGMEGPCAVRGTAGPLGCGTDGLEPSAVIDSFGWWAPPGMSVASRNAISAGPPSLITVQGSRCAREVLQARSRWSCWPARRRSPRWTSTCRSTGKTVETA
jgi:hypothetical protein